MEDTSIFHFYLILQIFDEVCRSREETPKDDFFKKSYSLSLKLAQEEVTIFILVEDTNC